MSTTARPTAELDELGFTLLPNWAPADLLAELRATVARLYALEGSNAGSEFRLEPGCLRLANLMDKDAVFLRVIAAPALLALVRHVIGPDFKLSSLNCRTALPGSVLSTTDVQDKKQDHRKHRQGVPLQCVRLVLFSANFRARPVAHEAVVRRGMLLDHVGLERES